MKVLIACLIVFGLFLAVSEFNTIESCCPRSTPPRPPTPPPPPGMPTPPPEKPDTPAPPPTPQPPSEPTTPPEAPAPTLPSLPSGPIAPGAKAPAAPAIKGSPRPSLGFGLMPLIQTLGTGSNALLGVADSWEVWWSRNRDRYLDFKQPVEWVKIVAEGTTQSAILSPTYDKLINILSSALEDNDHFLAFRAAIALGKARDARRPEYGNAAALDILKKAHESESRFFVRNNILLALGLTGDSSVSDTIKTVLKSKDPYLRRSYAALAAGFMPYDKELSKILKDILNDRDNWEVKCCVCIALGNLKDESAVPVLGFILNALGGANKEQSQIKAYAALGLGRIGSAKALAELKKCTPGTERDIDVKSAVAIALGLTGLPGAKDPLLLFLKDRNGNVRGQAALSLGMLSSALSNPASGAKDGKLYDIIWESYQTNKLSDAEGWMILGLGLTGDNRAKTELRKILESKKDRVLSRAAAAVALGLLKDKEASPLIIKMLEDNRQLNDVILTPYLILSLGMIQDANAVTVLQGIWDEINSKNAHLLAYHTNLAIALTLIGKRNDLVLPKLVKQAEQIDDSLLRIYALHTLSLVSDKDSAALFVDSFNDKNTYVKFSTVDGIGFLLDARKVNPLYKITGDNIDMSMQIMDHILPIPVW